MAIAVAPSSHGSSRVARCSRKERGNDGGYAQYKADVGDVGTDGTTYRQNRVALNEVISATTISGAEVPRDTTVKPIKILRHQVRCRSSPRQNLSALQMRAANPTAISIKLTHIRVCPCYELVVLPHADWCRAARLKGVQSKLLIGMTFLKPAGSIAFSIETLPVTNRDPTSRIPTCSQGILGKIYRVGIMGLPVCSVVWVDIA